MTNNGPSVWDPLLSDVRKFFPSAVLAGGAIRDYVVDPTIKPADFDFFLPVSDELEFEMTLFDLREKWPSSKLINKESADFEYKEDDLPEDSRLCGVYEIHSPPAYDLERGFKLNIVGKPPHIMSSYDALFGTFDHSLCDFVYTGDGPGDFSKEAEETLRTKKISIRRDRERTRERLRNLTSRRGYEHFSYEGQPKKLDISKKDMYNDFLKKVDTLNAQMAARPNLFAMPQWDVANMEWRNI